MSQEETLGARPNLSKTDVNVLEGVMGRTGNHPPGPWDVSR